MIYHFYQKEWILNKFKKLVDNLHVQTEYVIYKRNLKQALNYGLVLEKVYKVNNFYQNAYLKPYIDINKDLRKKGKYNFGKDFLSWWRMQFLEKLWKIWENIEITETRKNCLVSEWNCHTTKFFTENILAIEAKKNWHNYE